MFDFFRCFFKNALEIWIGRQLVSDFEGLYELEVLECSIFSWILLNFCIYGSCDFFQFSRFFRILSSNIAADNSLWLDLWWETPVSDNFAFNCISSSEWRVLELFYKKINSCFLVWFGFFIAHICLWLIERYFLICVIFIILLIISSLIKQLQFLTWFLFLIKYWSYRQIAKDTIW